MTDAIFEQDYAVEWDKCDMFGRLTLAGLNNIITLTAGNHALNCKIGYPEMKVNKQAWVLIRLNVKIKKMPLWQDIITCRTWVVSFNGILSERVFELVSGGDVIGTASSVWSVINYELRIPQQLIAPYNKEHNIIADKLVDGVKANKIKLSDNLKLIGSHKVAFSDMDAMQHANNTKYTQWIYNCLPLTYIKTLFDNLDIHYNYLSELVMGDDVEIYKAEDGLYTVARKGEQKPCFALKITKTIQ